MSGQADAVVRKIAGLVHSMGCRMARLLMDMERSGEADRLATIARAARHGGLTWALDPLRGQAAERRISRQPNGHLWFSRSGSDVISEDPVETAFGVPSASGA